MLGEKASMRHLRETVSVIIYQNAFVINLPVYEYWHTVICNFIIYCPEYLFSNRFLLYCLKLLKHLLSRPNEKFQLIVWNLNSE